VSFTRVADSASVAPGAMRGVVVGDMKILLVNLDGAIIAYEDACPHRGVPLSWGMLEPASGTLTCGMHLQRYDVRTGKGLNVRDAGLRRLPAKLQDDGIWVDVEPPPPT
jgi:3-phenylpropionate/trans-cinnamate dioxygenase ferredoxin subunit